MPMTVVSIKWERNNLRWPNQPRRKRIMKSMRVFKFWRFTFFNLIVKYPSNDRGPCYFHLRKFLLVFYTIYKVECVKRISNTHLHHALTWQFHLPPHNLAQVSNFAFIYLNILTYCIYCFTSSNSHCLLNKTVIYSTSFTLIKT